MEKQNRKDKWLITDEMLAKAREDRYAETNKLKLWIKMVNLRLQK